VALGCRGVRCCGFSASDDRIEGNKLHLQ